MQKIAEAEDMARVLVYPENVEPSFELKDNLRERYEEDHNDAAARAEVRPDFLEADAINRIMMFAREIDRPIHFVHMSSEKGLQRYRKNLDDVPVTAEAQVQHLIVDANEHDLLAKMNPPIRTVAEQRALAGCSQRRYSILLV